MGDGILVETYGILVERSGIPVEFHGILVEPDRMKIVGLEIRIIKESLKSLNDFFQQQTNLNFIL